jgi:Ca2+/H+ antiporter
MAPERQGKGREGAALVLVLVLVLAGFLSDLLYSPIDYGMKSYSSPSSSSFASLIIFFIIEYLLSKKPAATRNVNPTHEKRKEERRKGQASESW